MDRGRRGRTNGCNTAAAKLSQIARCKHWIAAGYVRIADPNDIEGFRNANAPLPVLWIRRRHVALSQAGVNRQRRNGLSEVTGVGHDCPIHESTFRMVYSHSVAPGDEQNAAALLEKGFTAPKY